MPAVYADLTELAKALHDAGGPKIELAVSDVIRHAAYEVQRQAQELAPKDTGALASSITVNFNGPGSAVIGPKVPYGVFQEFGTGSRGEFGGHPYPIVPKRPGGLLVFQVNGQTVFAKKVMHPGVRAKPYMRPAAKQVLSDMAGDVGDAGVNVIVEGRA